MHSSDVFGIKFPNNQVRTLTVRIDWITQRPCSFLYVLCAVGVMRRLMPCPSGRRLCAQRLPGVRARLLERRPDHRLYVW